MLTAPLYIGVGAVGEPGPDALAGLPDDPVAVVHQFHEPSG